MSVEAPVIDGSQNGKVSLVVLVFVAPVEALFEPVIIVVKWLCSSENKEANCHTSRKEHREVGCIVELRLVGLLAKPDVTVVVVDEAKENDPNVL